jgi:hypothetical protein
MLSAIRQFRENIQRVRALGGLFTALSHLTTSAIDATDLLRAQVVMAVSALDHYIHEITRIGMLEVFNGSRPRTDAFLRFQVTMDAAMSGLAGGGGSSWFEAEIRERHGYLAFQYPDKIADAIRLFSSRELWPSIASILALPVQDVKNHLRLIIERRNKISHEADLDPSYPGSRWPIHPIDVQNAIDFIEKICEAIHSIVL